MNHKDHSAMVKKVFSLGSELDTGMVSSRALLSLITLSMVLDQLLFKKKIQEDFLAYLGPMVVGVVPFPFSFFGDERWCDYGD